MSTAVCLGIKVVVTEFLLHVFMVFIKAHVLHALNFSVHLRSVLVCISMCAVYV